MAYILIRIRKSYVYKYTATFFIYSFEFPLCNIFSTNIFKSLNNDFYQEKCNKIRIKTEVNTNIETWTKSNAFKNTV